MTKPIEASPLYRIANPRSIAIFGASNKHSAMGTGILFSIRQLGFEGPIYPVHPREEQALGYPAYRSVSDVPEVPDLAVIVLPTPVVPDVLEECGKKGIRHAIIVSGGFKEVGGEGVELEKRLTEVAAKYDIRFLGPNCIGAVNPHHRFNATYFAYPQEPGFIGMASQSGSFITQMFSYLQRFDLGFSTGFSVGNEANIDIVDCMEYLAACPNTKVIGLYIESIRRGRAFIDAARAIAPKKPIVAYYVGGTEAGRLAGLSHTGALAGPDKVYDGVFRQSGVIRAHSIEELFDICWCLGACRLPKGNRVIVQTHSGGPGAVTADACSRAGLKLPPISPKTKERLAQYVPHTGSINNPIDFTFLKNNLDYLVGIPKVLQDDENADAMLMYMLMPRQSVLRAMESIGITGDVAESETDKFLDEQAASLAEMMRNADKTCIGFSYYTGENRFIKRLYENGVPVLPSPNRAATALGAMVRYMGLRDKISKSL